jgi:hypothetical protein
METKKKQKKKLEMNKTEIVFSLLAPDARSVFLCGDFNQYRFLVDGEWQNDPNSPECVANPFGTSNCLRIVG